jgi:hypothetical protein
VQDFPLVNDTAGGGYIELRVGPLAPGASRTFSLFYGATSNKAAAISAVTAVGAQVYNLGQPATPNGPTLGTPITAIFAVDGRNLP